MWKKPQSVTNLLVINHWLEHKSSSSSCLEVKLVKISSNFPCNYLLKVLLVLMKIENLTIWKVFEVEEDEIAIIAHAMVYVKRFELPCRLMRNWILTNLTLHNVNPHSPPPTNTVSFWLITDFSVITLNDPLVYAYKVPLDLNIMCSLNGIHIVSTPG